jgi:hypothetical protein
MVSSPGFSIKTLPALLISPMHAAVPAHLILFYFITLVKSTNYVAPHYAILSILFLLPAS